MARALSRGDIHLCEFPRPDKARPVLVLTRQRSIQLLATVTVAPITTTIRGVPSEVVLDEKDGMKGPCAANLHNLVTIQQSALGRRVTSLSGERLAAVCSAMQFALGCAERS